MCVWIKTAAPKGRPPRPLDGHLLKRAISGPSLAGFQRALVCDSGDGGAVTLESQPACPTYTFSLRSHNEPSQLIKQPKVPRYKSRDVCLSR